MITLKRFSFEMFILYRGKIYEFNPNTSAIGKPNLQKDVLTVEVYNRKLKGKTDLHGQPYKPSIFYYSLTPNN